MRHEKIFKRADGSRVKVIATYDTICYRGDATWDFTVQLCKPRKKTWENAADHNDLKYRGKPLSERYAASKTESMKHTSKSEILETMLELWEMMKPNESMLGESK